MATLSEVQSMVTLAHVAELGAEVVSELAGKEISSQLDGSEISKETIISIILSVINDELGPVLAGPPIRKGV